jgi:DNA end-binding protein Ku
MATRPLLAGVVEQALSDILPDRFRSIQPDSVDLLDLDGSPAAAAGDPQQMPMYFGKWLHSDRGAGRCAVRRSFVEHCLPVFRRHLVGWSRRANGRYVSADGSSAGHLLHLIWGRHAPVRGSIRH